MFANLEMVIFFGNFIEIGCFHNRAIEKIEKISKVCLGTWLIMASNNKDTLKKIKFFFSDIQRTWSFLQISTSSNPSKYSFQIRHIWVYFLSKIDTNKRQNHLMFII